MTEPLDLEPIKARLEAATIGPWEVAYDEPIFADDPERYVWKLRGPENAETASHHIREIEHLYPHDAELIAHAPTDIAALVSEVEQLRALQRALNTVLDLVEDEEVVNMFARVFEAQEALLAVARKIR